MGTRITLRQIEYFVSVAESGQLQRSAVLCNVSQSTLTVALKNLENMVGKPPLVRHATGVHVTSAGERFLREIEHASSLVEGAVASAREEPENLQEEVRIGVTVTISVYFLPALLSAIARRFSNMKIEIVEEQRKVIENML